MFYHFAYILFFSIFRRVQNCKLGNGIIFWHDIQYIQSITNFYFNGFFLQISWCVFLLQDYLLWLSTTHSNHALNVQENTTLGSDTIINMPLVVMVPRVLDLRVFDRALQPSVKGTCSSDDRIKLIDELDRHLHISFENILPYILNYFKTMNYCIQNILILLHSGL